MHNPPRINQTRNAVGDPILLLMSLRFKAALVASVFQLCLLHPFAASQDFNTLTDAEKAEGWLLLFDGKSLAGWHSYMKATITTSGWGINDSAIYRRDQGAGAILSPEKFKYQDFELSIDWKIPDPGNSGIFIRYLEVDASENIRTGPESQICGRLHGDYGEGIGIHSPGACYDMYAPAKDWIKPADQYNTFRVVVFNKRIAHYGNGVKLLEYEIDSPDWTTRYQNSKYKFFPQYGEVHAGKLFLQDHGSPVWFRNIKMRPLTVDPWTDAGFRWPDAPDPIFIPRGFPAAAPGYKLSVNDEGAIVLDLPENVKWRLGLSDAEGRLLSRSSGTGLFKYERESGMSGAHTGPYFLQGTVGGEAFSSRFFRPRIR
jgi:hypothetical protein